ncbi:MAG: histidinol-phosphate transaminase [Bacteroidales bacterium]|nr:histidinol-phosphate transaminase [Candidatus Liminaster caballi]
MELSSVVRPNILALEPYSCARDEFKGEASVFLDANESPYNNGLNRYPDPLQSEVKRLLAPLKGVHEDQIFLGNGSDEAIDLIYRIFCQPHSDNVVAISPSYGMYKVCADVNDVLYHAVPLTADFQIDRKALAGRVTLRTKVIWICSPNNPTGNAFPQADIEFFASRYPNKIIVVDEAYIDFSSQPSMTSLLDRYPNLIVLQTFSKAWGHAAMRLGIAMASREIISLFNKVKYPYNVSELTQREAVRMLTDDVDKVRDQIEEVLAQRDVLRQLLLSLPCVECVYPSDANFLLVRVSDANAIYMYLQQQGVIVRNRNSVQLCAGCLRITVGTPEENATLFNELKTYTR